ncbi:MAG: secretin N-terminal domain-containing protein [Methylotenera sp.]
MLLRILVRHISVLTVVTSIFCLLTPSVQAESELKIITLQNRFADDLLPTITPMIGEDGTATGLRNQLIVRASPERIREIEMIVKQLDIARENRRITVNRNANQNIQDGRIGVNGKVRIGEVIIGNNRRTKTNSNNIYIEETTRTSKQSSSQFLNVLDGERAFIRVGQFVPFTQEWLTITSRFTQIERITEWQEISTGFAVRPRAFGNQVELEITPRITRLGTQGTIDFEELTTILRVQLGEWVDIAATMQNQDEVSRKILGVSSNASSNQNRLVIKVD